MNLRKFDALIGQNSYVRCIGKERVDSAIVGVEAAEAHLFNGGTIGWWVRSGYIVVDIDEGQEQALSIIKKLGLKTLVCRTTKGIHLYFKEDRDMPQKIGMVLPFGLKCDYRCANKGYVLLPFGVEGRAFNKIHKVIGMPLEFTPIPNRKESLFGLREGDGRNATLFAHLMAFKNRGANNDQIELMGHIINEDVFKQPMKKKELEDIINNTKRYEAQETADNPYLLYNAKGNPSGINYRAINDYFVNKGDVFVIGGECYMYQDGVYKEASSIVRNAIKEMINSDNMITQQRIMEAYRLIIDDNRIQRSAHELNSNTNLINFKNGVWDIEKHELLPHDSKYLQTIQIRHNVGEYIPLKETKLWNFLQKAKIDNDNKKMILRYMAYCLTLQSGLKTFMVLSGQSNTGKSVLIRFIENLVGKDNTSALSMHELNMRFYPAQLYNKLLNSCADNSSLPLSAIENLKKITGGDQIMYEKKSNPNIFFFTPFAKLLFSFNQLPLQLEEKSNAFYKRMRILSMTNELFLNDDYVNDLCSNDSIESIIPYLLKLLPIKAIPHTDLSDSMVEGLRKDSDSIHSFMEDKCVKANDGIILKSSLYDAYARYCFENEREAHKKQAFMRRLRAMQIEEIRHPRTREACWKGIKVLQTKGGKDDVD